MRISTGRTRVIAAPTVSDHSRPGWRIVAGVAAIGAAVALTLAACSAGSASSNTDSGGAAAIGSAAAMATAGAAPAQDAAGAPAYATEQAAGEMAGAAGDPAAAPTPGQLAGSTLDVGNVIKTADLSLTLTVEPVPVTDDTAADREANIAARAAAINQAAVSVRGIATAAGGFQSSADGGGSSINIGLRVPADQYDAVMDKLGALGEVNNRTESSRDVTAEVVDVNSRVESMTASVARVRALLAEATDIADVISIESELASREADLESLQQQQAALTGQVALSTITLSMTAVTDSGTTIEPVTSQQNEFMAGLTAGWHALLDFLSWIGGLAGALLPFLPLFAVVGLAIWWLVRRIRRPSRGGPGGPAPTTPGLSEPTPDPRPADDRENELTPAS